MHVILLDASLCFILHLVSNALIFAFDYAELLALLIQERFYEDSQTVGF